jgi:hypothetical protein
MTRGTVLRFIEDSHAQLDPIISFATWGWDCFTLCQATRLKIPCWYLNNDTAIVQQLIQFPPAELVFSIDESGLSDSEERKKKDVIVSTDLEATDVHYGVETISVSGDA